MPCYYSTSATPPGFRVWGFGFSQWNPGGGREAPYVRVAPLPENQLTEQAEQALTVSEHIGTGITSASF